MRVDGSWPALLVVRRLRPPMGARMTGLKTQMPPSPKTDLERANKAEFRTWHWMIQRCTNPEHPSYKNYGGRGISVDPLWIPRETGFPLFLEAVGQRPWGDYTLDRIEVNGVYGPGNVRWLTRVEQEMNKRRKVN